MNSRERVAAALRCEQPDRVPYCELGIDRALAQKLMGWGPGTSQAANLETMPYTVQEARALAAHLKLDNLTYVLRAPVYAEKVPGMDGRLFYGNGLLTSRAALPLLQLPDPHDESLYAGIPPFLAERGDYQHVVRHPHGHLRDDARHGHRGVQRGALRGSRPDRGDPRPLRGLGLCRGRARLPDGIRRVRHHRRHGLQDRPPSSPRRSFASW